MIFKELSKMPFEPVSHNPDILKQVLLRMGQIPNITQIARAVFRPSQIAPGHTHYEMFLIEAGRGLLRLVDQDIPLSPGTFAVAEPGEAHEIANTGDEDLILLTVGLRALD